MVWSGALFRLRRPPSLAAIVEERISQCKATPAGKVNDPKAFSSESLPGLDPGWIPVRVKKTRQIKK
jgi:hypothetical protein